MLKSMAVQRKYLTLKSQEKLGEGRKVYSVPLIFLPVPLLFFLISPGFNDSINNKLARVSFNPDVATFLKRNFKAPILPLKSRAASLNAEVVLSGMSSAQSSCLCHMVLIKISLSGFKRVTILFLSRITVGMCQRKHRGLSLSSQGYSASLSAKASKSDHHYPQEMQPLLFCERSMRTDHISLCKEQNN